MAEGDSVRSGMKAGTRFGRFEILGELGSGGMGAVYRARDTRLGRMVALKVLHAESEKARADVLREARAAAKIDHPNAVLVFDADEVEGVPYIEMELIEGETLRAFIGRKDIALETKVGWLIDIARALGAAHEKGVIHRDLKPENVMVREDGIIKVLDFGIASIVVEVDRAAETGTLEVSPRTVSGATVTAYGTTLRGTPAYCSPEQLRGEPLDGRADQFSWGVLAYELMTGRHPFAAKALLDLIENLVASPPNILQLEGAVAVTSVSDVVVRTLKKNALYRFSSMRFVVDALQIQYPRGRIRHSLADVRPGYVRLGGLGAICLSMLIIVGAAVRARPLVSEAHRRAESAARVESPQRRAARADYERGMLQMSEGSPTDANDSFVAACHEDPSFAPAQVQFLASMTESPLGARDQLAAIRSLHDSLTEEERALVEAMEPLAESPPNLLEVDRRLSMSAERITGTPMMRFQLARTKFERALYAEAIHEDDLVLDAFPSFGAAAADRAHAYLYMDDVDAARLAAEECARLFPASTSCLVEVQAFYRAEGDCAPAAAIARRLLAQNPTVATWYSLLANLLFDDGRGIRQSRDELEKSASLGDPDDREDTELRNQASLAILEGDFVTARDATSKREAGLRYNHNAWAHTKSLITSMNLAYETGDFVVMSALANDFLRKLPAWFDYEPSVSMYALRGLYWGGALTRNAYVRKRDEWVVRDLETQARTGQRTGMSWIEAYVQPIRVRADAEDAFLAKEKYQSIPNETNRGNHNEAMVGEMYRLLGDSESAVRSLRRGAASCEAIGFPFEYGWANLHLGKALEAARDDIGACRAYAKVIGIWGRATPRSLSANVARERVRALRCSE